jgi:hypothetical protein
LLLGLFAARVQPAFAADPAEAPAETAPSTWGTEGATSDEAAPSDEPVPIDEVVPEWERRNVRTCISIAYVAYQPAALELGHWLRVGYTHRWSVGSTEDRLSLGAGVSPTWQVGSMGATEIRLGPFAAIESPLDRFRAEGGAEFALQHLEQMKDWTSLALALGAGVDDRAVTHGVATLSFGLRYVKARYSEHGACDPRDPPAGFGLASGLRLFAAYRQELRDPSVRELGFGLELGVPMLRRLAPPYTCSKWSRLP